VVEKAMQNVLFKPLPDDVADYTETVRTLAKCEVSVDMAKACVCSVVADYNRLLLLLEGDPTDFLPMTPNGRKRGRKKAILEDTDDAIDEVVVEEGVVVGTVLSPKKGKARRAALITGRKKFSAKDEMSDDSSLANGGGNKGRKRKSREAVCVEPSLAVSRSRRPVRTKLVYCESEEEGEASDSVDLHSN